MLTSRPQIHDEVDLLLSGLYVVTRDFPAIKDPQELRDVVTISDDLGSELLAQNSHESTYTWHPVREIIVDRQPEHFVTLELIRRKWISASTNVMSARAGLIYETLRIGLADELLNVPATTVEEFSAGAAAPPMWRRGEWAPALVTSRR